MLTLAVVLAGCANADVFDTSEHWFSRPFQLVSRNGGYTYSELKEAPTTRQITANDLVDANGACPPLAEPTPQAPAISAAGQPPEASSPLGEGIALGMSECDVVRRGGPPSNLQFGANANGDRTVVMTFNGGPRPGIYRFERGRLTDMDRVEVPSPRAPEVAKRKPERAQPLHVSTE